MSIAGLADRVLYRHPFEGASARRYEQLERPAFGDLDARLLDGLAPRLQAARRLVDLGAGPADLAMLAAARHPALEVIAVEPSRDFARSHPSVQVVRGAGEAIPLGDATADVAMCLSSIRHVRDREATLRELRRVVRPGGVLMIVELDPAADATRIANHATRLGTRVLRHAFGPLVVRTAPPAHAIGELATHAGWTVQHQTDDPVQPVYIMELA